MMTVPVVRVVRILSDTLSDSTSAVTHVGNCTTNSTAISISQTTDDSCNLDDILVIPKVKSTSRAKSVNSTARCITNNSFVQEIEEKEEQKRKKEEEMISKREERARKKEEREQKKMEKQKEKKKKELESKTGKKKKRQKVNFVESDCDDQDTGCWCPACGTNYDDDASNSEWVGCDGCYQWWHISCLGLTKKDLPSGDFFCEECTDN